MAMVKQGFEVSYNVIPEFIRTRDSGSFNGNDFKPAVTLTAINTYEQENSATGLLEIKKDELSFEISCENMQEVKSLHNYFMQEMKAHRSIMLTGALPYGDKVKCFETASSFLKKADNK